MEDLEVYKNISMDKIEKLLEPIKIINQSNSIALANVLMLISQNYPTQYEIKAI